VGPQEDPNAGNFRLDRIREGHDGSFEAPTGWPRLGRAPKETDDKGFNARNERTGSEVRGLLTDGKLTAASHLEEVRGAGVRTAFHREYWAEGRVKIGAKAFRTSYRLISRES